VPPPTPSPRTAGRPLHTSPSGVDTDPAEHSKELTTMNIVLWIIAGVLAFAFLAAGAMKLAQPKEKLAANPSTAWTEQFSPGVIKLIGLLEVLAAAGLILPAALDVVPVLVPLAALGLIVLMIGAAITHARRKENQAIAINLVLLVLAAVIVWGRLGPYSF
jgi:uncharacterized membrane protein YphA (DoxX/SURF4 family)